MTETSPVLKLSLKSSNMMDFDGMYQEFSNTFQFPDYFGYNMNALYDMLTDLSWLKFAGVELSIQDSCLLLASAGSGDREDVEKLLESVSQFWAAAYEINQPWGHPPTEFKIVYLPCT